jgi:outer membrane receptor protein involved in Fe transport
MIPASPPTTVAHRAALLSLAAVLAAPSVFAQSIAASRTALDPATLARFDQNKNGRLDPEEEAAWRAATRAADAALATGAAVPSRAGAEAADRPVELSPFEVVENTKGYFAANTMSGTRLNSNLEDLGAAISVITKEQMSDFAMLDINDVFLYGTSTEGSGDYTDFAVNNNGHVADNVQNNPRGANRIRGIGSANISLGNIGLSGLTPVDPLSIDGIEISRGPNANVFGLGSPGGTVNMIPASANLSKHRTQLTTRADSVGGYRFELDANRVLWKDRLALRFSSAVQHDAYRRKPSGTDTLRYNGMVRFQPFKWTTVNASYSYYRMHGNRPNNLMPRDSLTYWIQSGRPAWDPVTSTYNVNGVTYGLNGAGPLATRTPITSDNAIPDFFQRSFSGNDRSYVFIDGGAVAYWTTPVGNSAATPLANNQNNRYMAPSPASGVASGRFTSQPLFTTTPSLSNDTYYNWREINLGAMNRLMDRTLVGYLQLQQVFLNTPRQTLAGQADWLREDSMRYQRNIFGTGPSNQLLVDVNARLLDGSPNPFFGRPYIGLDSPLTQWIPGRSETYRGQLAYKLDLSRENNALRWLGRHQLSGYDEFRSSLTRRFSYRDVLASKHAWSPAGVYPAVSGNVAGGPQSASPRFRGYFRYYVGDADGANVDHAPTTFGYGPATFVWGNAATGVFQREPALLDQRPTTDSAGGGSNSIQNIKTTGGVIQSMFLGNRLVTTFGVREDRIYDKRGREPRLLTPEGLDFDYPAMNAWAEGDYAFNSGRTKTAGAVLRPLRDVGFVTRAVETGGVAAHAARLAQGLSLTYNQSDSFIPQGPQQDVFRNRLPNTRGEGRDWGFWLNLHDSRFVLRVNRFEAKRIKTRNGDAATIAQRVLRIDVFQNDNWQLVNNARAWITAANPAWTAAQVQAEIARQTGLSIAEQDELALPAPGISATQDVESRGTEIELNYNPTRHWTFASSLTETQTRNTNVSSATTAWIAQRMPIWTTIVDPRTNTRWWTTSYGGTRPMDAFTNNVDTPLKIILQQQGKANPQVRRYRARFSSNFQLAAVTANRFLRNVNVGGAMRWESKAGIGYYGVQQLPASITDLDPNRPIWDKAHLYADAFLGYRTKLFAKKIGTNFQINVRNLGENGRLQPVGAYPDGTPLAYRIVDPQVFIFQVKFDL